jgi:hypothetical protein
MRGFQVLSATVLMGMALATAAAADPITIVGGSLVIGGGLGRRFPETSISFSLTGDEGFSASGSAGEDSINNSGALCALFVPCAAGTTLNVGGGFLIGDGIGSATLAALRTARHSSPGPEPSQQGQR